MPLSALTPHGPIHLVGMDLASIEALKQENRIAKHLTAKCCGQPVQVRIAADRRPHFYHLKASPSCEGSKGETAEHLDLKFIVSAAAINAGWDVEVEAHKRKADGNLLWQADVLASRRRANIAFEIERSKPDWNSMMARQRRYQESGVRGLWFVKTSKPFPVSQELPVFSLWPDHSGYQVDLQLPDDWPGTWRDSETASSRLSDFVQMALSKGLVWAPYAGKGRDVPCVATMHLTCTSRCRGCDRLTGTPYSMTLRTLQDDNYPLWVWHQGMRSPRRSFWAKDLRTLLYGKRDIGGNAALVEPTNGMCLVCKTNARTKLGTTTTGHLDFAVSLKQLEPPRPGTIEWSWLNRWVLQPTS